MRFRLNSVSLFVMLACALPVMAEEFSIVLKPTRQLLALPEPDSPTPIFIYADKIEGVQGQQMEATDHVELRKLSQRVWADYLRYQPETQEIHAKGAVRIEQDNNTLLGPELHLNLENNVGTMQQPEYMLGANSSHGRADSLQMTSRQNYLLQDASYTTCPAEKEDWLLRSGTLDINQDTQIGEAEDVTVRWMGVPILYSPWLNFPLNNQRKSGLLGPVFGTTTKGGSELTMPYYWNIAPDKDATLAPRFMLKRGVLLNNEFRYLGTGYGGEVHADVLPNDKLAQMTRSRFQLKHQQTFAPGWRGNLLYNQASDNAYYRDLSDSVNTATQIYLPRQASLAYTGGGWWSTTVNLQRFQILQDPAAPVAIPYYRTPQILLSALHPVANGTFKLTSEFVDFSHPSAVNGRRFVINPSISYPLATNPGYFLTPKFSLHSTTYALGVNNNGQFKNNATRTLPIFSLDSGLSFERDAEVGGHGFVQTLEPRAYYVYIPYQDQTLLPVFDSGQAGFSYAQIFTENRFVGNDRVGDANQVTAALTSRMIDREDGEEWMRIFVGQRFSAITPKVNLVIPTNTTNKSDILLGFSARASQTWSVDSLLQYNPSTKQDEIFNASARYKPEPGKVLNFGYRFMRSTLNQPINVINHVNASAQWPLYGRWDTVVRANYSLQQNRLVEGLAGLEYNQDCWTFRFVAQRFAIATQQTSTGLFLQLELNGLVKVGSDPLLTLRQSIPGYTKMNQMPDARPTPNLYN